MSVLRGEHAWLESGIAAYGTEMGLLDESADTAETPTGMDDRELLAAAH